MNILGISCYYHDAAACVLSQGQVVAAAQEERFTRNKHDSEFPINAVRYCLAEAGVGDNGPDAVVFYDKPILKFHRILETYLGVAPGGMRSYMEAMPLWLKQKLWIKSQIQDALIDAGVNLPDKILFAQHHESHAASAFYPSPFESAAVITLDGVGEWATSTIGVGQGNKLKLLKEIRFPHSLGLLYSAFTYFTGFRVNSGEYKLMGLAPYGEPKYVDQIREHILDLKDDGSFRLNMDYFGYLDGLVMTSQRFADVFGGPARQPESPITRREMDLARSIQDVTEEIVLRIGRTARELTGERYLCLAGGVALNCVANGKLLRSGIFDDVWIQPASGDAGGALGAALAVWFSGMDKPRQVDGKRDAMSGSYLGPEFSPETIRTYLEHNGYPYEEPGETAWAGRLAGIIADEKVIGLYHGRMEFGPRALGNRSIIADSRSPKMQSVVNLKIKYRESFRPFAPTVLEERISDYFDIDRPSPYMLLVAQVREELQTPPEQEDEMRVDDLIEWVNQPRSTIPAITHVDYSARIQSVSAETNPRYHAVIKAFEELTGCGVIINTSFNVRGEPIVCTPEDAYRCFMRTEMDYLNLGPFLLKKTDQPHFDDKERWQEEFKLD